MKAEFSVEGVPPKKDGANSMWRKPSEIGKVKALRLAAHDATKGSFPQEGAIHLVLRIYADESAGDLDNFITGLCDGLMAVHPNTPIDPDEWIDLPEEARPKQAIAFVDDARVARISAERLPPGPDSERYDVEVEWV